MGLSIKVVLRDRPAKVAFKPDKVTVEPEMPQQTAETGKFVVGSEKLLVVNRKLVPN